MGEKKWRKLKLKKNGHFEAIYTLRGIFKRFFAILAILKTLKMWFLSGPLLKKMKITNMYVKVFWIKFWQRYNSWFEIPRLPRLWDSQDSQDSQDSETPKTPSIVAKCQFFYMDQSFQTRLYQNCVNCGIFYPNLPIFYTDIFVITVTFCNSESLRLRDSGTLFVYLVSFLIWLLCDWSNYI